MATKSDVQTTIDTLLADNTTKAITPAKQRTAISAVLNYADQVRVPAGGATDQLLAKASSTDNDLKWITPAIPGGGGGPLVTAFSTALKFDTYFRISSKTVDANLTLTADMTGAITGGGQVIRFLGDGTHTITFDPAVFILTGNSESGFDNTAGQVNTFYTFYNGFETELTITKGKYFAPPVTLFDVAYDAKLNLLNSSGLWDMQSSSSPLWSNNWGTDTVHTVGANQNFIYYKRIGSASEISYLTANDNTTPGPFRDSSGTTTALLASAVNNTDLFAEYRGETSAAHNSTATISFAYSNNVFHAIRRVGSVWTDLLSADGAATWTQIGATRSTTYTGAVTLGAGFVLVTTKAALPKLKLL